MLNCERVCFWAWGVGVEHGPRVGESILEYIRVFSGVELRSTHLLFHNINSCVDSVVTYSIPSTPFGRRWESIIDNTAAK